MFSFHLSGCDLSFRKNTYEKAVDLHTFGLTIFCGMNCIIRYETTGMPLAASLGMTSARTLAARMDHSNTG